MENYTKGKKNEENKGKQNKAEKSRKKLGEMKLKVNETKKIFERTN